MEALHLRSKFCRYPNCKDNLSQKVSSALLLTFTFTPSPLVLLSDIELTGYTENVYTVSETENESKTSFQLGIDCVPEKKRM